jgi:hypothetical protein
VIAEVWLCFAKTKYEPCRGKNTYFIVESLVTKELFHPGHSQPSHTKRIS